MVACEHILRGVSSLLDGSGAHNGFGGIDVASPADVMRMSAWKVIAFPAGQDACRPLKKCFGYDFFNCLLGV